MPPLPGVQPPSLWGTRLHLESLFGTAASAIDMTPRTFQFRYRSAAHFIAVFRDWYGPVHKAFASLSADQAEALTQDLTELLTRLDRSGGRSLVVPSDYAEIVITRR